MNYINHLLLFICSSLFICLPAEVHAQDVWEKLDDKTFELNPSALGELLSKISKEKNTSVIINFPDESGNISDFRITDNSLLPESLAVKYPNVHAYKGVNLENKNLSITLTCNSQNITATLIKGTSIWSLQQLENTNIYRILDDSEAIGMRINCGTNESNSLSSTNSSAKLITGTNNSNQTLIGDNTLRVFRTAIVVTGEYSNYFVNKFNLNSGSETSKKAAVLGGIVASLNNLNTVFERDLGIRFELIENNDELIFLDAATDPFTSDNGDDLIDTGYLQMSTIIGLDNLDIGHVLSIGFNGLAEVSGLCSNRKAQAVSAGPVPEGTEFDFTLLAHEFGHQLGANHTQNYTCNRNNATAVEPGSGSTIMGYAGACDSFVEIQTISDEYFHLVSINQIKSHIQSVSCGFENIEINNNLPVIEQLPNYTIPADTNFILEANTTDADNDPLTYCWEQLDTELATAPPVSTSAGGPLFRSLEPNSSPSRNFPEEYDTNTKWEVLPTVSREMNFGLTVRDGKPSGISTSTLKVDVVNTGEKFEVTSPLGGGFPQNSVKEIKWQVAGTDANGINTENVNIELSYDQGQTFTVTLAENTPNDGSQNVILPIGNFSENARIKISPVNNIYYTISQSNFSILEDVDDDLAAIVNPIEKVIKIQVYNLQVPEYEFTLYDLSGKLIKSEKLKPENLLIPEEIPVDVSYLTTGIYIMKLVVGSQIYTRKIIKI